MKGFNFPGINQEGNENMADGRSKSSAFQKKDEKETAIEAIGGVWDATKSLQKNPGFMPQKIATGIATQISSGKGKPRLQMKKSVKQKLIPKSRYTGRKPQSQMTDAEYNKMLSKKRKKSPLKSKDDAKTSSHEVKHSKIKRPKGYYKDGKKITKKEYDALAAVAKRNVSVVSKKKK
tara:strand:+ start:290 stop:820 length:531 start_codon:yes stop_codon:yes gene_type:complete